jgi:hypothetical protein
MTDAQWIVVCIVAGLVVLGFLNGMGWLPKIPRSQLWEDRDRELLP